MTGLPRCSLAPPTAQPKPNTDHPLPSFLSAATWEGVGGSTLDEQPCLLQGSLGKASLPKNSAQEAQGQILRSGVRWGWDLGLPGRWLKGEGTSQLPTEADATRSCCLKNSRGLSGRWAIMAAASWGHEKRIKAGLARLRQSLLDSPVLSPSSHLHLRF